VTFGAPSCCVGVARRLEDSASAPLVMYHQQSQAIVPLRGKRCTRLLTGAFAPEPRARFACALVQRASKILHLNSYALH
jgi:hypothetical protein